jgi:AcrR family transcriptional regulator
VGDFGGSHPPNEDQPVTTATPRMYFDEAMRVLSDHGFHGLTINALCTALGVTSGSFYHHFGSWRGFVSALLADWEEQQTALIISVVEGADVDPLSRFALMLDASRTVPRAAEASIRSWANTDPEVALTQKRVDAARLAYVEGVVRDLGMDRVRPAPTALLILAAFIGLESMGDDVDAASYEAVADQVRRLVLGDA